MVPTSWVFDVGCCVSGEWSADGGGCVVSERQKIGLGGPSLFVLKTYDMVDDRSTNSIISWSYSGRSFVVWNQPEFCRDLLPQYFNHNNFSSFIRQLNTYGFRKIDPDQWEFANDSFTRGQRQILKKIHRKKPVFNHSLNNQSPMTTYMNSEKKELEEELERLKHDKTLLELELQNYQHVFRELESLESSICSQVTLILQKQKKMVTSFNNLVLNPHPSRHKKKRKLPPDPFHDCEMLDFSSHSSNSVLRSYLKLFQKLQASLLSWESFISEANEWFFSPPEDDYVEDTERRKFVNSWTERAPLPVNGFDMNSMPGMGLRQNDVFWGEEVGEWRQGVGIDINVSPEVS